MLDNSGGVVPDQDPASKGDTDGVVECISGAASAVINTEAFSGWVTVGPSKTTRKGLSLPNPEKGNASGGGATPLNKAATGPEKGQEATNKGAIPKIQSSNRSKPSGSVRVKTWFDPDDRDLERGTRQERTAKVVLPPGTRNATRSSFIDRVGGVVGLHALEACGPAAAPNIWLLTFVTKEAKATFVTAGNFLTSEGLQATVESSSRGASRFWIKLHWIPYQVTMVNALRQLESIDGIKIIAANYDKVSGLEGLSHVRSLLRTVLIEAADPTKVPYSLRWSQDGASGVALVTVKGRPPVCLKCGKGGHVRKDCTAEKCSVCSEWGHNDPTCTRRQGYARVTAGAPVVDEAAEVIDEDLDVGEQAAAPAAITDSEKQPSEQAQGTPVAQVKSPQAQGLPGLSESINSALGARDTSAQPTVKEDPGVGSWAESMNAEDGLPAAFKPVSPMSAATSSGNSGGETSDESVAYESPSDSSVSSAGSKKCRRIKRGRDKLGWTQSLSPLAKKK